VVWYHKVADERTTMHARIALDGTHLLFEETSLYQGDLGAGSLLRRMSLDRSYEEEIAISGLGSTFAETDQGSIVFDDYSSWPETHLVELQSDGTRREIWTCDAWMHQYAGHPYACDPNETVWVAETDTVLWSMWATDTVVEIQRESGELLRQFGEYSEAWTFEDPEIGFDMQHYPHFTADGTLLVSTHVPGSYGQQRAREYRLDEASQTLVEVWSYGHEVPHYAIYAGEALRLDNGNTLINYGSSGALREVTPDKRTTWELAWPSTYLLGHMSLVEDLYALAGPEG